MASVSEKKNKGKKRLLNDILNFFQFVMFDKVNITDNVTSKIACCLLFILTFFFSTGCPSSGWKIVNKYIYNQFVSYCHYFTVSPPTSICRQCVLL